NLIFQKWHGSNRNLPWNWHGLNRKDWHSLAEKGGTNQTVISTFFQIDFLFYQPIKIIKKAKLSHKNKQYPTFLSGIK
ncbi:hypothetical protein ACFFUR_00765, partial [Echinicola jeungdonensis]